MLKEGQTVEVKIEAVDREQRKLSLSLAEISRAEEESAADLKKYQQQASEVPKNMGTLGDIMKAKGEKKEKK